MVARSLVLQYLHRHRVFPSLPAVRYLETNAPRKKIQKPQPALSTQEKGWLTRKVEASPTAMTIFQIVAKVLGYGSPKQVAGRRGFVLYGQLCAIKPDEEKDFWHQACRLPPTFQSWFTVTNLHIWMLTVRLRALPEGKLYTQALIDHFFIDVEDRIRAVLQPSPNPRPPYTFRSYFYVNPNAVPEGPNKRLSRAPDRLVTRQMKVFKEQWAGLGLSFDLALVKNDMEMAGAVWRNLLGARGAQGIAFLDASSTSTVSHTKNYRRSINLVGGEVVDVAKVNVPVEETRDDGSGVHDFSPEEADLYLEYPQLMLDLVGYVRRELARLERLSDEEIMNGPVNRIKFGSIRS